MANREKKLWQRTGFFHVMDAFWNTGKDALTYRMFNAILKRDHEGCAPFRLIKEDLIQEGIISLGGSPKIIALTEKGKKLQGIIKILEQNMDVQAHCFHFDGYNQFGSVKCKLHGDVPAFKCRRRCAQFLLKEVPG